MIHMKIYNRTDIIDFNGQAITVSELISSLANIDSKYIKELFQDFHVPKFYRVKLLKNILDDESQKFKVRDYNILNEFGFKLTWYKDFTENQLFDLLIKLDDGKGDLIRYYKEDLWLLLIQLNYLDKPKIYELYLESKELYENLEDLDDYNKNINTMFKDYKNYIDGISTAVFQNTAMFSLTINELRKIADKLNVDLPKRIKKKELIDYIYNETKEKSIEELEKLSIVQLHRYAHERNLKISTGLKKEEIIDFIVKKYNDFIDEVYFDVHFPPRFYLADATKKPDFNEICSLWSINKKEEINGIHLEYDNVSDYNIEDSHKKTDEEIPSLKNYNNENDSINKLIKLISLLVLLNSILIIAIIIIILK